jgi:hypothetical protein
MRNKKAVSFYSDLYRQNYYFLKKWDRRQVEELLGIQTGRSAGITSVKDGAIYIWIENCEPGNMGELAHECVHASSFTFDNVGIEISIKNDEVHSYLIGWIFEVCFKSLGIKFK